MGGDLLLAEARQTHDVTLVVRFDEAFCTIIGIVAID